MRIAFLSLLAAAAGWAQVTAPLLGWLPEGSHIRRMNGLPGAASLGPVMNPGRDLARIAISPRQDYALASDLTTGQVDLILPGISSTPLNVPARPDEIAVSPRGSSAVLWYGSDRRFEIVTGLPGSPAIHDADASAFSGSPAAVAVSDDGQRLAAAFDGAVYALGDDGPARTVYGGTARALAFYAGRPDLAVATPTQILCISDIGGSANVSALHVGTFSPAGIAVSSDNRKIVMADTAGAIVSIDAATSIPQNFDCRCRPAGVFGLSGQIFRLTNSPRDAVTLFDAAAGGILAVPRAAPSRRVSRNSAGAFLPAITINLSPSPTGYLQQPTMTVTAATASPTDIQGTVTLTFAFSGGGDDQSIQFSTGGQSVDFTIPANTTQATFSGKPSVSFSTGTVAGTITVTAIVSSTQVATKTIVTNPTVPFISTVTLTKAAGSLTVVVTGFSSTRDMTSGLFHFAPSTNATLSQTDLMVGLGPAFTTWYQNPASNATGSQFTLTMPFTVQGSTADIVAVTVTLTNSKGASNPVSPQ